MELAMGKPIATPHIKAPDEAEICRLEKAAWDVNAEHVVIWYRDQIAQLRARQRETERAWKLEDDRRRNAQQATWRRASHVVAYYTGRDLDLMDEEYTKETGRSGDHD
jgi:hypothetical protein